MTTYRAPSAAAMMTGQLMTEDAILAAVAASDPSMQSEVERVLRTQDRARRLLLGKDEFDGVWRTTPEDTDGGPMDVLANAVASVCAFVGSMNPFPEAPVHFYIQKLAETDVAHPLVAYRTVMRDACQPMGAGALDWSDLDAAVLAGTLPQVGQPCLFVASDESHHDGVISYVWGPEGVNLEFDENGATRTASSVRVVRQLSEGDRYVCVLRPMA